VRLLIWIDGSRLYDGMIVDTFARSWADQRNWYARWKYLNVRKRAGRVSLSFFFRPEQGLALNLGVKEVVPLSPFNRRLLHLGAP
jgi:hypothetical protein